MLLGHRPKEGHKLPSQMADFFLLFYERSTIMKKFKDLAHWLRRFDTHGTKTELNNILLRTFFVKIKIRRLSKTVVMQFGVSVIFSSI
jgi:hypothetical protein